MTDPKVFSTSEGNDRDRTSKLENAYVIGSENFNLWSQGFEEEGYLKVLPHPDQKIPFEDPFQDWQEDHKDGNFVSEGANGSYYSSWGPDEVLEVTLDMSMLEELVIDGFGTLKPGNGLIEWLDKATPYDVLRAYNGRIPGPMLITEPGDTLRITLNNDLEQITNLHTHGLHVSALGNGDNVLITVPPGESWYVEIEIPENHFIGPQWYHPHFHGETNEQVASGLGGYLLILPPSDLPDLDKFNIVTEPVSFMAINTFGIQQENRPSSPDDSLNQSPDPNFALPAGTPLQELEEGVFSLSDAPFVGYNAKPVSYNPQAPTGSDSSLAYGEGGLAEPTENVIHTVNGQYNPTIEASTGQWNLFGFANMSVNSFHVIQLIKVEADGTLTPQTVQLTAIDGDAAGVVEGIRREITETPILNPGSRVSIQHWFEEQGTYYFLSNATEEILGDEAPLLTQEKGFNDGHLIWGSQVLATVEVTGEDLPTGNFPEAYDVLVEQSDEINALVDAAKAGDFDQERDFVWSANIGGALLEGNVPDDTEVETFEGTYRINGKYFSTEGGGMPPLTMPMLGTSEIWNITNISGISDEMLVELGIDLPLVESHPFHIHQNDFVVLEINGIPVEDIEQNYLARVLSDTIALPPSYAPGSVTPENPYGIAQMNGEPSVVKILMEFADYPGSYVNHCHILFHEDAGMMAVVRVILNTEDTWLGLGEDSGGRVDLFQASDTTQSLQLNPYGIDFEGGVDVAIADVNFKMIKDDDNVNVNDNVTDVATIQRHLDNEAQEFVIKVFDGQSLFEAQFSGVDENDPDLLLATILPFQDVTSSLEQEASIATGDLDGDGFADLIAALGGGIQPIIEVYSGKDASLMARLNPFHHGGFTGTINVASGDIDGDNFDDILVAQGAGGEGKVEAYSGIELYQLILSDEIAGLSGNEVAHKTAVFSEAFQPYGDSYTAEVEITSGYVLQTPEVPNDKPVQTNAANITTLAVGALPDGHERIKIHTYAGGGHHGHTMDMDMSEGMEMEEVRLEEEFTPEGNVTQILGTFADLPGDRGQGVLFSQDSDGKRQLIHLEEENVLEFMPIEEGKKIRGTKEDNELVGTQRGDTIAGLQGNDIIYGRGGDDTLFGGRGKDTLFGGRGKDTLFGGRGKDTLFGDEGDDNLRGQRGDDLLSGGLGDDRLFGGRGDDTLFGGRGNDILLGKSGDDLLNGDFGDDEIRGGLGDDILTGGFGSDLFVLAIGEGIDTIRDFQVGEDFIGLADGLTFDDLSFVGSSIISGAETLAVLNGIDTTTLTQEGDFVLV